MLSDMRFFGGIEETGDGEAAWNQIKERFTNQFALVVADLHTPKLDGLGLIRRCHNSVFFRDIPFLATTSEPKPELLAAISEYGVRDCVVKPFSMKVLQDRVVKILRRVRDPGEKAYKEITRLNEEGDFERAFKKFGSLGAEDVSNPKWLNLKGETLMGIGKFAEAREHIEKALMACEIYLMALTNFAKLHEKMGNLREAVDALEKADTISPLIVERKVKLGDMLMEVGRPDEGKAMLQKAVALAPDDTEMLVKIGDILAGRGYTEESEELYRKVITEKAVNVEAYNKIAMSLRQQRKYKEAEDCYRAALKHYPDNAVVYHNMGVLYLVWEEKRKEACKYFTKALQLNPELTRSRDMIEQHCGKKK